MRRLILFVLAGMLLLIGWQVLAQEPTEVPPILQISVASATCDMVIIEDEEGLPPPEAEATPEAEMTPEPEATPDADSDPIYPVITLGEDCDAVQAQLRTASGVIWVALSAPDEEEWQKFETLPDDDSPLRFDGRGRFVGCPNVPICQILWEYDGVTYLIEIPMNVITTSVAPRSSGQPSVSAPSPVSAEEPVSQEAPVTSGSWGGCGSCTTCGANTNVCVLSPDGVCLADPANCDAPPPSSGGGDDSGPPRPQSTEES
jgi:hypothetical protein